MLTDYELLMEYQIMIDQWKLTSGQNDKSSMSSLYPWQSCLGRCSWDEHLSYLGTSDFLTWSVLAPEAPTVSPHILQAWFPLWKVALSYIANAKPMVNDGTTSELSSSFTVFIALQCPES